MTWQAPSEALNHEPTEFCPHPELWTAWNSVSAEVEVSMLVASFVRAMQPEFTLEIGSHYGQTTERIARVIIENKHGKFVSLELSPDFCGSARARCVGLPAEIVQINSLDYVPPQPIDLLFIDGAEENRFADLEHFYPYLSKFPTILVHDIDYYHEETMKILEFWMGDSIILHTPRGLMILVR